MAGSELHMIKQCAEFLDMSRISELGRGRRGIYVLMKRRRKSGKYDVVYIGMASGSIRSRLYSHRRLKQAAWTHFSAFEVWENIREDEIRELEGLFRHIYRYDTRANKLNKQRGFKKLRRVRNNNVGEWK